MRGYTSPPPKGTIFYRAGYDAIDPGIVIVVPVLRDERGRQIAGEAVNEYSGVGAFARAMRDAEMRNKLHGDALLWNIQTTPSAGEGAPA